MSRKRAKTSASSKRKCEPPPAAPKIDPISAVMKWVLQGATERDIREAIEKSFPGEDPPALLAAVIGDLEKAASCPPDVLIGWCFEATREMYRRMVEIGDYPGALRAVKQILELTKNVHERFEPEEEADDVADGQTQDEQPEQLPGS